MAYFRPFLENWVDTLDSLKTQWAVIPSRIPPRRIKAACRGWWAPPLTVTADHIGAVARASKDEDSAAFQHGTSPAGGCGGPDDGLPATRLSTTRSEEPASCLDRDSS